MQEKTQWMKYYLEYCRKQKNLNDKTIKAYRIDLRQYIDFLASRNFEITTQSVRTYVMFLHDSYQVRSIKRKVGSVLSLACQATSADHLTENNTTACG